MDNIVENVVLLTANNVTPAGRVFDLACLETLLSYWEARKDKFFCVMKTNTFGLNISKISHQITDLWIDNGELIANIKILDTTAGKMLADFIDCEYGHFSVDVTAVLNGDKIESNGMAFLNVPYINHPANMRIL